MPHFTSPQHNVGSPQTSTNSGPLPIAIIGAGPVGLAAAAHLIDRGLEPMLFEAGPSVAHHVHQWRHVRMFSPWEYNLDPVAVSILERDGWTAPNLEDLPTGDDLSRKYLEPLANHPSIAPFLKVDARVVGVSRLRADRMRSLPDRDQSPFVLQVNIDGDIHRFLASAVIDASGTWGRPSPAGADGLPAIGETRSKQKIFYGIPDIAQRDRARYENRRVAVIGAGHSAIQSMLALIDIQDGEKPAPIHWILRNQRPDEAFGGGKLDALPARGALGVKIQQAVEAGSIQVHGPFLVDTLTLDGEKVSVHGQTEQGRRMIKVDEVIVATGARPDLSPLSEIRLDLDPLVQAPQRLAPLIDPNLHSCGTVPPHGEKELQHPEKRFYIVGSKAYGRAPTFLLRTGYEQVRSVVAHLAGDVEAARRVELVLPETGVCSSGNLGSTVAVSSACCGGAG